MSAPIAESHPLGFFLPDGARLLMLGSFPPPRNRWSMDFYYPNIQNDMWRILGYIFFGDKTIFLETPKAFSRDKTMAFCREKGIALGDTAQKVIRQNGNASDRFLEVVSTFDPTDVLSRIPLCCTVTVTGQKAMDTFLSVMPGATAPEMGRSADFEFIGRRFRLFRMPSSSRAYPMSLEKKADIYRYLFRELGMI